MNSLFPKATITQALDIHLGDVIAFVGAGGKTSLLLALAKELFQASSKVMVTATTKIGTTEQPKNGELILGNDPIDLQKKAEVAHEQGLIPVLASKIDEEKDRLIGLDSGIIDELATGFDYTLIEADGARRKPFKIPKAHEPVVPECVTKLCIVIGSDALGKPINEQNFYNIEGMIELGAKPDEPLTTSLIFKLLYHPYGYTRFKTEKRELFLILNKFDSIDGSVNTQDISSEMYHNSLEKIFFTSTKEQPLVRAVPDNNDNKIAGVILAAGKSSRFNGLKQSAKIGDSTLIYHVTNRAINSDLDEVAVVIGHEKDEVKRCLGELKDNEKLSIIENDEYENGLSTSLKAGLRALQERSDAIMFILGDQPNVNTEFINNLLENYKNSTAKLCVPMVTTEDNIRPGNPVIIGRKLYPELLKITGDAGARVVVRNNLQRAKLVKLEDDRSQFQINTQEDLIKYKRQ